MNTNDRYAALLAEYQPCPVTSPEIHAAALERYEDLMRAFDREPSAELGAVMEMAVMAIEAYERDYHPRANVPPAQLVAHLLEARGMNQSQLADRMGVSRGQVSNILNGSRKITVETARSLSEVFSLPAQSFLAL